MKIKITPFISLFFCSMAFSQMKDSTAVDEILAEVVVTGTRTQRKLSTLPLPTTVITSETILKTGFTRLSEILNEQTGIILIPDESGFEGIQMQGLDAAYIMILIDGVPWWGELREFWI